MNARLKSYSYGLFQKHIFQNLFGTLKASSNVTENKTTLQKLKFILKKIKQK